MQHTEEHDGIYRISTAASLLGAVRRVLPDAVPPLALPADQTTSAYPSYGWIGGACAAPNKGDRYIVEFVDKRAFRVIAYVDRYGRVFTANRAVSSPPAREPDLNFARFSDQRVAGEEHGCVEVHSAGDVRQVARYVCRRGRYTFSESWYNFGPHGSDLSYDDALVRAYLAFVYRPAQGGAAVPARGLAFIHEHLQGGELLPALRGIVDDVHGAEADPVLQPPALARSLVRWLGEAGLPAIEERALPDDALCLARTMRYANLFYVSVGSEDAAVTRREVWALEAALNRFVLVEEVFGESAAQATDADCARWDTYLIETAASAMPSLTVSAGTPEGLPEGEWALRCRLATAIERLRLPFRLEARMQVNVEEGVVALGLSVPDGAFMPAWRWVDAQVLPDGSGTPAGWVAIPDAERTAQALRYAMHVGMALATVAFEASSQVQRVGVAAFPCQNNSEGFRYTPDAESSGQGEFPHDMLQTALYQVVFSRSAFQDHTYIQSVQAGDPVPFFASQGVLLDVPAANPLAVVEAKPSARIRQLLPEAEDAPVPEPLQEALGATQAADLRISFDGRRRRIGEGLADQLACARSATGAIRMVRAVQDAAEACGDDHAAAAATRLMAALAEGSLDTEDQNEVVGCFLGEDRCLAALGRARSFTQKQESDKAVAVLVDAVAEAAALDGFVDGPTTVHRSFDTYAARVRYNRARAEAVAAGNVDALTSAASTSTPSLAACAAADEGRRVQLVSDSFYLCHLEIVRLLEHSFERTEEALRYGRRAIELAPATVAGYRQLGRAYMLVGDMENAIATLSEGLRIAVQPNETAIAYYQLAYALWKAGQPRAGAACYMKSLMTAPVVGLQATAELKELANESNIKPIMPDEVDAELAQANIVLAPSAETLAFLTESAAAATDAGMFPLARELLSLRLRNHTDDALVDVLRSLDVPTATR